MSVDPITAQYPELTPYQFASNRPIDGIDLDGKEWEGIKVVAPDLWNGLIKWWQAPANPKMAEAYEFVATTQDLSLTIKTNGDMVKTMVAISTKSYVENAASQGLKANMRGLFKKSTAKPVKQESLPIKPDATEANYQQENKMIFSADNAVLSGTYKYTTHPQMYDAHGHGYIDEFAGMNVNKTITTLKELGAGKYKVWNIMACDVGGGNFASDIAKQTGKYVTAPTQRFSIDDDTTEILFKHSGTWNVYDPNGKLIKAISNKEFRTVDDLMKLIQKYTGTK